MFRLLVLTPLLAGVAAAYPQLVCAQPTRTVSIEEVIEYALRESPLVREIDAAAAASRAEGIALGTLQNPVLDGEYRRPTSDAGRKRANEAAASLSQPLRLSNFGQRQRVNELIQKSADTDRALAVLGLTEQLRLLYAKGWALSERRQQLASTRKGAEEILRSVEQAIGRGLFGKGDGALFRAEERRLKAELVGIEADLERVRAELTRKSTMQLADVEFSRPLWLDLAITGGSVHTSSLPIQRRAELLQNLADEHSRLARMDRFPRFAPRLVYARTNDGFDYGGVGISVDLPVFDTNRAEKQKREAEASAARATATYFSSDSFAQEVGYLSKAIGATYSQSEITRSEVVPALEEALRTFKQRLQSGQAALPQIWQTIQAVNEARQTALDLFVKAATARAELSVMVGEDV